MARIKKSQTAFWHSQTTQQVFSVLKTKQSGLSEREAAQRLEKLGPNLLPQKKATPFWMLLFKEFLNPIIIILLVAMAFSFAVGELLDAFVILGIILIDAIISAVQEKRAAKVAKSLSAMVKVNAKVLRDGHKTQIEAKNLVVGDIVFLESGDKVPADLRIVECSNFTVDESLLTGESINVEKSSSVALQSAGLAEQSCMVFSGSSVITGRAKCVVVETAHNTQIGAISKNLNSIKNQKSPLNIRIAKFSKQISLAIVAVSAIIFVIMLLQANPYREIFLVVIALAVSAMPEGMPLAVTMALTVASNRMGKKNVVVKNLNAVESLGSCTVIATDKTGTLTLNQQTAKILVLPDGQEAEVLGSGYNTKGKIIFKSQGQKNQIQRLSFLGDINNEAVLKNKNNKLSYFGDSIDIAFKVLAKKLKIKQKANIINHIPYESENKFSAVFFEELDKKYCTVKGSLEKVLEFSSTMKVAGKKVALDTALIKAQNQNLASRGFRVIAIAEKALSKNAKCNSLDLCDLCILGLVGFIDPVRPESKASIAQCKKAGIKVLMITGDHPQTAFSIAQDVGIATDISQVTTGAEIDLRFAQGQASFDDFVKTKTVFARVTPNHKLQIVDSLKRQGEFVAVTGDGVNDSPAIKSAHIGVAMGSGTDVAKETADMIILDDNFSSIVEGVKEGRCAYANIRKITYFLLSCSVAEVLFFVLALVCGAGIPLLPIQLLWLNVVTDGFQDLSLSLEKPEPNLMQEKPRSTKESLFTKSMVLQVGIMGSTIGLLVFGAWMIFTQVLFLDIVTARTLTMALMVFLQNFHALNCRSEKTSVFKIKFQTNWFFAVAVLGSIGLQVLFMEVDALSHLLDLTTVSYLHLLALLALGFVVVLVSEVYKHIQSKRILHNSKT